MRKLLAALLLALIILLLFASPVFAYLLNPSSVSVPDVKVFRNLAEVGDSLYVFEYAINIPSDNYSSTPASDSFLFRLYDVDGVTLKSSTQPYVYPFLGSNGYDMGVSAFYFGASDNASAWDAAVKMNIQGLPFYYSPAVPNVTYTFYTLTTDDYVTANTSEENRSLLKDYILLLCDRLTSNYAATGVILKTSSDSGIVLSNYGENYFRGAIPGIQDLCPGLFYIQVYVPGKMDVVPYDSSVSENYSARLTGTDMGEGFTRIGEALGTSQIFGAAIVFLGLCLAVCIWTIRKDWGIEPGIGVSILIGIFFALIIGDLLFTLLMIASLLAAMGIVYMFILKRA